MKNFLNNKKFFPGAVALLVVLGFVNAVGVIGLSGEGLAQVFNISKTRTESHTYYAEDNGLGEQGISFKQNKVISVSACAGAGGGGGGGRGWDDGSGLGNGGGGGGGGGQGDCYTGKIKLRAGDTMRWQVGTGGFGGLPGSLLEDVYGETQVYENLYGSDGQNGHPTFVSVNGIDVVVVLGGQGGQSGDSAYYYPGIGGAGGQTSQTDLAGHMGVSGYANTDASHNCWGDSGQGGAGGSGYPLNTGGGAGGAGGGVVPNCAYSLGYDGEDGDNGGGGGGGGGLGLWVTYDGEWDIPVMVNSLMIDPPADQPVAEGPFPNNANVLIHNRGGAGGNGDDGIVNFYW